MRREGGEWGGEGEGGRGLRMEEGFRENMSIKVWMLSWPPVECQ